MWDGEAARSLTGALDLPVTLGFGSDLHDWMGPEQAAPIWDGEALIVPINRRGRDEVWRVPLAGDPHPLTAGDTSLTVIAAAAGRSSSTATDDAYPPEICAVEPGRLRRLTRHGGRVAAPPRAARGARGRRRRRARRSCSSPRAPTAARRSCSRRTAAPTARMRRRRSSTRGC